MKGGAGEWESLENESRWKMRGAKEWESLKNYGKCIKNYMITRPM
jgi:hypothetical protein